MNMMREIGNNVVGSTSPMVRSPPVSPRSLQRVHAVHGPGMSSDKRMTSPKGSMSRMMRMSSGSDLRGWLKIGSICSVTTTKTWMNLVGLNSFLPMKSQVFKKRKYFISGLYVIVSRASRLQL